MSVELYQRVNKMDKNPIVKLDMLKLYRDYTYSRADIYFHKDIKKLPMVDYVYKPYSPEPLKNNKFTNVRRELDKETKYLMNSIIEVIPKNKNFLVNACANIILFRCSINLGSGWCKIINGLFNKNYIDFFEKIDYNKLSNKNLNIDSVTNSSAYMLVGMKRIVNRVSNLNSKYNYQTLNNIYHLSKYLNEINESISLLKDKKYEESLNKILSILGIGKFTAYQVYSDFCYLLNDNKGLNSSVAVFCGPGTKAGLDMMFSDKAGMGHKDLLIWFRDNIDRLMKENNLDWNVKDFLHFLPEEKQVWDCSSVANSFCEFKKLVNILNNNKTRRRKYAI